MKLSILREDLLKPLQLVAGIAEKRNTFPILSNVLLQVDEDLSLMATDLEVELRMRIPLHHPATSGALTVPARKLVDICRTLPENALLEFTEEKNKVILKSGKSRFTLATLPASDFPKLEQTESTLEFTMPQKDLLFLISRTCFAMAQQDVRYFLNGMLLEVSPGTIRAVATDGHRLAMNTLESSMVNNAAAQVIIPRKGVLELERLLGDSQGDVNVAIMTHHIKVTSPTFTFTSKLIEGRFPHYDRVLPRGGDKIITLPREELRQSLSRAAILSNEKLRGVQIQLRENLFRILATNPDSEEAEEEIGIDYNQVGLDIAFNVKYLTDIFDTIDDEKVVLIFADSNTSVLVEGSNEKGNSVFVVMPMRL